MKKRRTFWDDPSIGPKLDAIPEGELSTIVRMALRQYFGVNASKPDPITPISPTVTPEEEPLTLDEAKEVVRLMLGQKKKAPPPEG